MTAGSDSLACVALLPPATAYRLVGAGLVLVGIAGMNLPRSRLDFAGLLRRHSRWMVLLARHRSLLGPGSAAVWEIDDQRRRAYTIGQDDGDVHLLGK